MSDERRRWRPRESIGKSDCASRTGTFDQSNVDEYIFIVLTARWSHVSAANQPFENSISLCITSWKGVVAPILDTSSRSAPETLLFMQGTCEIRCVSIARFFFVVIFFLPRCLVMPLKQLPVRDALIRGKSVPLNERASLLLLISSRSATPLSLNYEETRDEKKKVTVMKFPGATSRACAIFALW